ncbi:ABC transporter ATP-binding protein [Amorphus orientalis]|uniref:Peptide/nickel transport system ATP-binding protein n=1 Tax=Amorphus orientalis TaxID=649198 RepID=A0AAE4ASN6_9HYPH|nr:ABC transporter ATP-binding protein [Amorphus orientalis]MDQ0315433.1 peptide/nickel transport system ATP-binding protein [Amorphus orientalis]
MSTPILTVDDLIVTISSQPVLRGVSLKVMPGEVHGLVGESGAGKSTIGKAVLGLLPRTAAIPHGFVMFDGVDLPGMAEQRRRQLLAKEIALIPQDPMTALNPVKRIGVQMTWPLTSHLGMSRKDARERALSLLNEVAIRDAESVLERYPHELSGGMRQRVLIAMAFSTTPRLIIADEPTTALDVTVQRQILSLIRDLQTRHDASVLFVTHDLGVVAKVCDRVTVLHAGRVLEQGDCRQVIEAPQHPYTQALLGATPRFDRPGDTLAPVPAELADRLWSEAAAWDADRREAAR